MIPTFILTAFLAQAPAPAADRTARVEGQVVSSTTGDPLRKAIVELHSETGNSYTSTSDAQGKFLFEEVMPGAFTLHAERVGYVSQKVLARDAISTLRIVAGQKLNDLVVRLIPQGSIYGRITDEDGDPVRNSDIDLLRWSYQNGKKELRSIDNSGLNVNDDGTFVIGYLPPGRYFAKATHGIPSNLNPGRKNATQDWYVPTYYPSAIDPASAAPIDIAPGVEVRGVEIRLRKTRVFHVRGKATTNLGGSFQDVHLSLGKHDGTPGHSSPVKNDGTFEFINVLPGAYWLEPITYTPSADGFTGTVRGMAGRVSVTISDADVNGLVVTIGPGIELAGRLRSDDSKTPLPPGLKVLLSLPSRGVVKSGRSKADGTFLLSSVAPDEYRVEVVGLPDGSYEKSFKLGDQNIVHKRLDLTSGVAGELEITLSPNAASLTGVVRNSNGDPVADAIIQLTRDDDEPTEENPSDQNGAFHIHSLAPGEYRVFAWQDDGDGIVVDPEFRKRFHGQSSKITLIEKSHETIEVKLITKESMDAEAAKMP